MIKPAAYAVCTECCFFEPLRGKSGRVMERIPGDPVLLYTGRCFFCAMSEVESIPIRVIENKKKVIDSEG